MRVSRVTPHEAGPVEGASAAAAPDYLGYLLMQAATRFRAATAQALLPLRLSPQEFGLLNRAVTHPGLTQAQLGALHGIDRTTTVSLLDRLAGERLVERAPDPDDRRVFRIHATRRGLQVHERAAAVVRQVENDHLSHLDAGQRAALAAGLQRIAEAPAGRTGSAQRPSPAAGRLRRT